MHANGVVKAVLLTMVLTLVLTLSACTDKGVAPPLPTLDGDWIVTNEANGVKTLLELNQNGDNLTGYWHPTDRSILVTGRINASNEFNLTGRTGNQSYVFNAEANDSFSRFSGRLGVFDTRGQRVSLQMISGRR